MSSSGIAVIFAQEVTETLPRQPVPRLSDVPGWLFSPIASGLIRLPGLALHFLVCAVRTNGTGVPRRHDTGGPLHLTRGIGRGPGRRALSVARSQTVAAPGRALPRGHFRTDPFRTDPFRTDPFRTDPFRAGASARALPRGTSGLTLPRGTSGLTLPRGTSGLTLPRGHFRTDPPARALPDGPLPAGRTLPDAPDWKAMS